MRYWCLLPVLLATGPLPAQPGPAEAPYAYRQLDDPAQEADAVALMESLRCIQCQGQSIADSDAPIAGTMRSEVRTRIAAGERPDDIRDWLVSRYGDWVSFEPPFRGMGLILWLLPLLFVGLGIFAVRGLFRKGGGE